MADEKMKRHSLKNIQDLQDAYEDLYNRLDSGRIDGKTSDNMNTVLKGSRYLIAELPMQYMKVFVMATKAKISIPPLMLPEGMRPKA